MRLTIGDYFQETPGFLSSLSYSIDGESPWEINLENAKDMFQLPMIINVNVAFTLVADYKPMKFNENTKNSALRRGRFFSLSDRGSAIENEEQNWLVYDE